MVLYFYYFSFSIIREVSLFFTEFPTNRGLQSNSIVSKIIIIPTNDQPIIVGGGITSLNLSDYLPEENNFGFTVQDFLPSDQVSINNCCNSKYTTV